MPEYPIVVRTLGGQNRLGVEEADALEADVSGVVTEGYEQIDVEQRDDGEQVGTVVATADNASIKEVHWE